LLPGFELLLGFFLAESAFFDATQEVFHHQNAFGR
jgi:hypothetical protein